MGVLVADRMRAYRARKKESGSPAPRGGPSKDKSKFDLGRFIAIDGEGWDDPYATPEQSVAHTYNSDGSIKRAYHAAPHLFTLLAASTGEEVYSNGARLSMQPCLDFLCDLVKTHGKKSILVCYGGAYDMQHILFYDLSHAQLEKLCKLGSIIFQSGANTYEVEYRPRKSLKINRYDNHTLNAYNAISETETPTVKWKRDAKGRYTKCPDVTAVLWDVIGFFQQPFVQCIRDWLGADHPKLPLIIDMKQRRDSFTLSQIDEIRSYNQLECELLVQICGALRDSLKACDLTLSRWDGAGAVAAAMYKKHGIKEYKSPTWDEQPDVFEAAAYAYSGGHIENMKIGCCFQPIYHYDINSAYPAFILNLPALSSGYWKTGDGSTPVPDGFTLVKVRYHFASDKPFYPLFYRRSDGSICYPQRGCGWYWLPEYKCGLNFAVEFGFEHFEVLEWKTFIQSDISIKPFAWVQEYYALRQEYVRIAKQTGVADGREKVIKLGLNSLYGKLLQLVGARWNKETKKYDPPPYFQLEWGGYVTASCRAALMTAAMQAPLDCIAIATDGLFSLSPLEVPHTPGAKILGEWDTEIHDGMSLVMPGVYWLHGDDLPMKGYSRGFDKEPLKNDGLIIQAWKNKRHEIEIPQTRLVGLGSAIASKTFFELRGRFLKTDRTLEMWGDNSKREAARDKAIPHKKLEYCAPKQAETQGELYIPLQDLMSRPYAVPWLTGGSPETDEFLVMADTTRELDDAENV